MRRGLVVLLSLACVAMASRQSAAEVVFSAEAAWLQAPPAPGGTATVVVTIAVDEGWHINSNAPLDEFLVPTRVLLTLPPGWTADAPAFPRHRLASLSFSDTPVAVFEGVKDLRDIAHVDSDGLQIVPAARKPKDEVCVEPFAVFVPDGIIKTEPGGAGDEMVVEAVCNWHYPRPLIEPGMQSLTSNLSPYLPSSCA